MKDDGGKKSDRGDTCCAWCWCCRHLQKRERSERIPVNDEESQESSSLGGEDSLVHADITDPPSANSTGDRPEYAVESAPAQQQVLSPSSSLSAISKRHRGSHGASPKCGHFLLALLLMAFGSIVWLFFDSVGTEINAGTSRILFYLAILVSTAVAAWIIYRRLPDFLYAMESDARIPPSVAAAEADPSPSYPSKGPRLETIPTESIGLSVDVLTLASTPISKHAPETTNPTTTTELTASPPKPSLDHDAKTAFAKPVETLRTTTDAASSSAASPPPKAKAAPAKKHARSGGSKPSNKNRPPREATGHRD